MTTFSSSFHLSSPAELIAAVPYMLGFHPQDSVVAVGLDGLRPVWILRIDLGGPAEVLAAQAVDSSRHPAIARPRVVFLGYGSSPDTVPVLAEIAGMAGESGVPVVAVLRIDQNRYYCLDCVSCPATDGMSFDPSATRAAATATFAGLVALANRQEFLSLAAADPAAQQRMESILDAAFATLGRPEPSRDLALVDTALAVAHDGRMLTDDQAAKLAIVLHGKAARDHAWMATDAEFWQRELWFDLLRRVPEPLAAPVACLAAWAAWRCGDTLTAIAALDRADLADPLYSLTNLLRTLVDAGLPPSHLIPQWPMPELLEPEAADAPQNASGDRPSR